MAPHLTDIDHVHVFVSDRAAAEAWYGRVMGLARVASLESWATGGGPLTIADASGGVHLALFEKPRQSCRSVIALATSGAGFLSWQKHLQAVLGRELEAEDHELSWSLYFEDPDGNPFEITSYAYGEIRAGLGAPGA